MITGNPFGNEHPATEAQADDHRQITLMLEALSDAWGRGDAPRYGALFSEESDYVAFDGSRLVGRAANVNHHRALFASVLRRTRLVFEGKPSIRFIHPDTAVVHAMGSVLFPWHEAVTPRRRSIQTYVFHRRPGAAWRIEAFHNTRRRPLKLPTGLALWAAQAAIRVRAAINSK